jgi:acetyl esterase/lipase
MAGSSHPHLPSNMSMSASWCGPTQTPELADNRRTALLVRLTTLVAALLVCAGCSGALFRVANAPAHFSPVQRWTDIPYGALSRQRLDIYSPPRARQFPVVVFWYGGAWTDGVKSNYRFVGTALAENGFVAVLPDYRLYPEATFPAFVEDAAQAVAWVEHHAEEFGGDPTRIVLMGHSAGAHIAAMLAVEPSYLAAAGADKSHIAALVGLSGPYVLEPDTKVLRTIFSLPYQRSDWQPVQHVNFGAPPTLLLHGLDDHRVLPVQAREFHDALVAHGVRVEMELYSGKSHIDTIAGFSAFRRQSVPTLARTVRFLRSLTQPQESAALVVGAPARAGIRDQAH